MKFYSQLGQDKYAIESIFKNKMNLTNFELDLKRGHLVANAPELRGIKRKNEKRSLHHIRGKENLIPGTEIAQRYEFMEIDYPEISKYGDIILKCSLDRNLI